MMDGRSYTFALHMMKVIRKKEGHTIPYHPCMVYLPTFG